jgi:probable HAF family extracellular repeat protein
MFLADSTGAPRRVGAAIVAAFDFCFPKCEKLSLTSYLADRRYEKSYRAEHATNEIRSGLVWNFLTFDQLKLFRNSDFEFRICDFVYTWHALRLCARQSFPHLFLTQSFKFLCIVFTALALTGTTLAGQAMPPTAAGAAASASGERTASRKNKSDVGIRGHGFVADNNVFTTIDAPGARSFTVAFGIDNRGRTVGGYVDERGRLHGFLKDKEAFTVIDFPGAQGTFATRVNDQGQIVGVYSDDPNTPALKAPHGFLFDNGVFTKIAVPGAVETRPFGINNAGQIVGEYVDEARRSHGFLFANGTFTTIDAPDGTSTWATDIDDSGRIVGISFGAVVRGFLRDAQGAFTPIDAPAAPPPPGRPELPATQPLGLNNRGQIVGIFGDSEGTHAFLLDNGVFTTLDAPDSIGSTLLLDINDGGQLAGAYDIEGHGVLQDRRGNFTTIDHPDGVGETVLAGINNRGQIVGGILDASRTLRSFLFDDGDFTTIDVPGALSSSALKINDRGQIVGAYSTLTNKNHAFPTRGFLWDAGVATMIDVPGALHTGANGINNSGRIVGDYVDANGVGHGFIREPDGNFTTIDIPGATSTGISDINDHGQMTGLYVDADGKSHGFLWDNGVVTNIDAPGATLATLPLGINNRGDIVGGYFDDARRHGFVFSDGKFTTTTASGAFVETFPFDIDDRGQIVGFYF